MFWGHYFDILGTVFYLRVILWEEVVRMTLARVVRLSYIGSREKNLDLLAVTLITNSSSLSEFDTGVNCKMGGL